jgi:hypothetical protein
MIDILANFSVNIVIFQSKHCAYCNEKHVHEKQRTWQQWFMQIHDFDSVIFQKRGIWLYQDIKAKGWDFPQKRVSGEREGHFLVFEIWKKSGNKLFPCPDDLEWPIVDKIVTGKSYRIGLKKIVLQSDTFKYLEYKTGVKDAVNVRKTNIMECDLKMITALLGNVGISILNKLNVCLWILT